MADVRSRQSTPELAVEKDEQFILEQFGDPAEVVSELQQFGKTTRSLTRRYGQLADKYAGQWVAAFDGKVRAHGRTFEDVLEKVDQEGLPREHTVVRFIDNDDRTMIL
jgi:hypothetical protein